jgi:hypothetical protein
MAHFARIDSTNTVTEVIVAEQSVIDTGLFGPPEQWLQTSYNTRSNVHVAGGTPYRGNFAGPGMIYRPDLDAFIGPRPDADTTWILDLPTLTWRRPLPEPELQPGQFPHWNEATQTWTLSNNPWSPEDMEL